MANPLRKLLVFEVKTQKTKTKEHNNHQNQRLITK